MKAKVGAQTKKTNNKNIVLSWKTTDQVFKKSAGSKAFKEAHKAESARIEIARSLREARTRQNLTQADLAKQTAMPQSAIARLESGNHSVSFETLSKVAYALGKEIKIV
jgi:ribosome-binding protein aMBF1 (putative translation factor)